MREAWSSTKLTVAMKVKAVRTAGLGRTASLPGRAHYRPVSSSS